MNKQSLGQYFTTNIILKEKLFSFIKNEPDVILEPSIGQGDLIVFIKDKLNINFDMYEIDKTIKILKGVDKKKIIYGDFLEQSFNKKYKTIIGNPPYIRTKKGNKYIDFVEKCYNLLEDNGELIFIVPSDFLKLTSASKLLNMMMINGTFTDIYHPHNEKLFEYANIDIIIFRYCKNNELEKKVHYNDNDLYIINSNGLITFDNHDNNNDNYDNNIIISDLFDIYVGIVSGKDEVYKNDELGNINVLTGHNKIEKFIFIKKYPCEDSNINDYLLQYKDELIERRIKKFNERNWFEWGAPRNISSIEKNKNKDCIYIYNMTRKENVAFTGKVDYFGGNLIMILAKNNDIEIDLNKIVKYFNSDDFKKNFMFSGRFKIGHRQLSNSYLKSSHFR
jgi:adenine-specific DNA-methyltransferase